HKPDIETVPEIKDAMISVERRLDNEGRVLIRYSGTEPLCRVMVEGPSIEKTRNYCQELVDVVKKNIGKRKEELGKRKKDQRSEVGVWKMTHQLKSRSGFKMFNRVQNQGGL
ncbi:MAG: hypothetical protein WBZ05_12770, partial [Desulfobacterales bacterium]